MEMNYELIWFVQMAKKTPGDIAKPLDSQFMDDENP